MTHLIKRRGTAMFELTEKTAVITGASRGIGKAIAVKFASQGANIAFLHYMDEENAVATEKELNEMGIKAKGYECNVADFEASKAAVEQILEDFGEFHILVNNAGITRDMLLLKMGESDFDAVISVNLKGAFNMSKHVYQHFMKKRRGRIINISSIVGLTGNAGQVNYSSAKAGMIGMTKSIAKELGSRNVTVNAIAPGFIITAMTDQLSDEVKKEWCNKIPLRRGGTPEDIADVATFLASDMSSYVSGQVIQVDGGMNM